MAVSAKDKACGSCGASIIWATSDKGHAMPLDPEPAEDGNVAVTEALEGRYFRVLRDGEKPADDEVRMFSHFMSCPFADRHRRPRRRSQPALDFGTPLWLSLRRSAGSVAPRRSARQTSL